ncbi:phosphoglycolate phosphatase, chromosomal [mine drainage metagenome]|uniref:phosphoglycolate phosphatase n=1 Tax=mine drainage metagenome TaxID=410659 RepID=A0A1J5R559_9ZZZZ
MTAGAPWLDAPVRVAGVAVRAAIVDLDGTMVDTLGDFHATLNRMLPEFGLPAVGREQVEVRIGKGSEYLVAQTLRIHLDDARADAVYPAAIESYQRHYANVNGNHANVFPGVAEGLQRLADAGLALACITNKPTAYARELLRLKDLLGFFRVVNGGDAFPRKKPDPMPLLETCRQIDMQPAHTLMVGDSQNDALAAKGAGCAVVLATYGYNHGEPIRATPAAAYFDRLDQLELERDV